MFFDFIEAISYSSVKTMRTPSGQDELCALFLKAYADNQVHAIKQLFLLRDARNGIGERAATNTIVALLYKVSPQFIVDNLAALVEVGYYKDLLQFADNEAVLRFWAGKIQQGDRLDAK